MRIFVVVVRNAAGIAFVIFNLIWRGRAVNLIFLFLTRGVLACKLESRDTTKSLKDRICCCWTTRKHNFLLIHGNRRTNEKRSDVVSEPLVEATLDQRLLDFGTDLLKGNVVVEVFNVLVV